jgi:hypothetical protein
VYCKLLQSLIVDLNLAPSDVTLQCKWRQNPCFKTKNGTKRRLEDRRGMVIDQDFSWSSESTSVSLARSCTPIASLHICSLTCRLFPSSRS